jgi:hypothetical protein
MRHAVAIAVEREPEIFVNQCFGGLAIVVGNDRQGTQRFRLESIQRPLPCLTMLTLIGNFGQLARHDVVEGEVLIPERDSIEGLHTRVVQRERAGCLGVRAAHLGGAIE